MKSLQLQIVLAIAGIMSALIAQSAKAEKVTIPQNIVRVNTINNASLLENRPATTVKEWTNQIKQAQNQAVQVTNIRVNSLENEVEIVLETLDGKILQIDATKFRSQGNSLIADIPNAVLVLPTGQEFSVNNPTGEIANIRITQINETSIRVNVSGKNGLPTQEVSLKTGVLIYTLNPDGIDPGEEIIITGNRRTPYRKPNASIGTGTDTPILETPFSVQVIPQEVIRDRQAIGVQEALTTVSGVTYFGNTQGRDASFNIRGFGSPVGNNVPVLRDGYRLYGTFQAIPEIANLEQVEVLKGPASILYGQIDPGGIINLVSKQPLATPFYEAEFQVGSRGLIRPRIDLSGPLTPEGDLLYRLNIAYTKDRTFRNLTTDSERFAIAPTLKCKLGDRTDLNMNVEYIHDRGPADFGMSRFGNTVAPVSREFIVNNPDDTISKDYTSTGYTLEHRFDDNWKIRNSFRYLEYDYDYGIVALPIRVVGANIFRFFADQDGQDRSYSLFTNTVGNFITGSVKHTLTAGIDLNRSESRIVNIVDFVNPSILNIFNPNYNLVSKPSRSNLSPFTDTLTTTNRTGIYLQDQIYLWDNLIVVGGVRYDTVSQTTTNVKTAFNAGGETSQNNNATTPRFGLLYRPIPEVSLFANYSQSFRPNTATTANGAVLDPELGKGYEVGVKTELFEQKVFASLAYFDITKSNVAVSDPNNPLFSTAVGEQNSRGFELDLAGEVLPGWKILTSYAYIDAKVTKDSDTTIIGNRLFGVPQNKFTLWTTYELQEGDFKGLGFGVGLEYASDRFGNLENSYRLGDYLIGNAAIFYRYDNYRFGLNIKNISNANYTESSTGTDTGIYPGAPFTIIGSVSVQF
jgi:iron complex outermembrane receptor protein